jgi:hypothetical protein
MCDKQYRNANMEYQKLLLEQIRVLGNEIKAWRMTSSSSHRMSVEEFMRSTDLCGWQHSLKRGVLRFPNFTKRCWFRLFNKST